MKRGTANRSCRPIAQPAQIHATLTDVTRIYAGRKASRRFMRSVPSA